MIDKILIIGCIVLAIAAAALGGTSYVRGLKIDALTADKALTQSKLDSANADIEVSTANHNRIVQEKDALLVTELAKAKAERDVAVQMAGIQKDISNAKDSNSCGDSDPFNALFDGLRLIEQQGDSEQASDPVPVPGQSRAATAKPSSAQDPAKGGRR